MEVKVEVGSTAVLSEEDMSIRKGPWTVEEDTILANYVAANGEGRWNSVAHHAGLKRTGKSCRLRWLNYLRPDVRRGNITLQEQILILDLHSRWGNRWSKIAQQLPGRTDNEIKNYWRTRVIKQAKQLNCDVNSKQFRDAMRYVWIPRLMERIRGPSGYQSTQPVTPTPRRLPESSTEIHVVSNSDHSESSGFHHRQVSDSQENGSDFSPVDFNFHSQVSGQGNALPGGDSVESLWNDENMWFLQQYLSGDLTDDM